MKLVHKSIDKILNFSINPIQQIVIENPKEFYLLTQELFNQCNDIDGNWILSDANNQISLSKNSLIIYDYYNIDFNSKKIQNAINEEVSKHIQSSDYFQELSRINSLLVNLNLNVLQNIDLPISFNDDFRVEDFIKLSKYSLETDLEITSKLVSYVDIFLKLRNIKLVAFINLSCILNDEQINQLLKQFEYMDILILMIDSQDKIKLPNCEKTIIDNDLCLVI